MTAPQPSAAADLIRAGTGSAYRLARGERVCIRNTHGSQVVDTWAFTDGDEFLSMEHTRGALGRLAPRVGDLLYSNRRRALLRLAEDTSPGVHDTLIPACDPERYRLLGHAGHHRSCQENFIDACLRLGSTVPIRAPLNLFMNVSVRRDGELSMAPSPAKPGDHVTLEALDAIVLVLSACPQDLVPINGERLSPADVEVMISRAPAPV